MVGAVLAGADGCVPPAGCDCEFCGAGCAGWLGEAGALAGGVLGAATGAIIGANTAPPPPPPPPGYYPPPPPPPPARCARVGYDAYGNQVCTAYYGY